MRFSKLLGIALVIVPALGACGSSGSAKPKVGVEGTTQPAGASGSSGSLPPQITAAKAAPIAESACGLATPAEIQAVLGAAGTGTEVDYEPAYKTCNFLTASSAAGNANSMRLAVIRRGAGEKAFESSKAGLESHSVGDVGDNGTFSSTPSTTGFSEALLIGNKGAISVAIDINFGGSITRPPSVQAGMTAIANAVFAKLGS